MEKKDRNTLKSYFKKGCVPSENQFAELIDSVPNIVDDGIIRHTDDGWAFFPAKGKRLQLALHYMECSSAAWTLSLTSEKGLEIRNEAGEIVFSLEQKSQIISLEAKEEKPTEKKDYDNFENEKTYTNIVLPADKHWHDILEISADNKSFNTYQVFACLSGLQNESYKVTSVVASNLGCSNYNLDSPQKGWFWWRGRIMFRWEKHDGKLFLQIRSKKEYEYQWIHCVVK